MVGRKKQNPNSDPFTLVNTNLMPVASVTAPMSEPSWANCITHLGFERLLLNHWVDYGSASRAATITILPFVLLQHAARPSPHPTQRYQRSIHPRADAFSSLCRQGSTELAAQDYLTSYEGGAGCRKFRLIIALCAPISGPDRGGAGRPHARRYKNRKRQSYILRYSNQPLVSLYRRQHSLRLF